MTQQRPQFLHAGEVLLSTGARILHDTRKLASALPIYAYDVTSWLTHRCLPFRHRGRLVRRYPCIAYLLGNPFALRFNPRETEDVPEGYGDFELPPLYRA